MAVIDKLNAIGNQVNNRHSYLKFVQAVLKAHGLNLVQATHLLHRSQTFMHTCILCRDITRVEIAMYRVALLINVPPEEILKPLNTGLNAGTPYTYQNWKHRCINRIHDRHSIYRNLNILAMLKGTSLHKISWKLFGNGTYINSAIQGNQRGNLERLLSQIAEQLDLSESDRKAILDNGYIHISHHFHFGKKQLKRYKRMLRYVTAVIAFKGLTKTEICHRHHVTPMFITNHLRTANPKVIQKFQTVFPELPDVQAVGDGDMRPFDQAIAEYGKTVHDRASFNTYVSAVINRYGYQIKEMTEKLGYHSSYVHTVIASDGFFKIYDICRRIADVLGVKPEVLTNVLSRLEDKITVRKLPVRTVSSTQHVRSLNIPYFFDVKPGTKMVVTQHDDGSLVYTPVDVYKKRHPNTHLKQ